MLVQKFFSVACGLLLLQLPFHVVEGFDVGFLELGSYLAREAHRKESEAVAGEVVHRSILAFGILVGNEDKIGLVEINTAIKHSDSPQDFRMFFAEVFGYTKRCSNNLVVVY